MGIRFVPFHKGFEQLRRSPPVQREVEHHAERIAAASGRGYEWGARQGEKGPAPAWNPRRGSGYQGRYRAIVYPATRQAVRDNARNNTLVKHLGGGW